MNNLADTMRRTSARVALAAVVSLFCAVSQAGDFAVKTEVRSSGAATQLPPALPRALATGSQIPSANLSMPGSQNFSEVPVQEPIAPGESAAVSQAQITGEPARIAAEIAPGEAPAAAASAPLTTPVPVKDADVRGKTLLLVGTRGSRTFIIEEAVRVAKALGLNLVLLDKAESRKNAKPPVKDYPVQGFDISHYQNAIQWAQVKTEGNDYVDDHFAENWKGADAAGLAKGAYHF